MAEAKFLLACLIQSRVLETITHQLTSLIAFV
jgi:hypothetical protein